MSSVKLIYSAIRSETDSPAPVGVEICCLLGESLPCVPRKDVLGPSFTDGEVLRAPRSQWISVAAAVALSYRPERASSWVCDGVTFTKLDRAGVRDAVLGDPPLRPWAGYATTSYHKHGSLRAPVNAPGQCVWLFESRLVDMSDRDNMAMTWARLREARMLGVPRSCIEAVVPPGNVSVTPGLPWWMRFEQWARPVHKSALYAFLCYLLPSQEEVKLEKQDRPAVVSTACEQGELFA